MYVCVCVVCVCVCVCAGKRSHYLAKPGILGKDSTLLKALAIYMPVAQSIIVSQTNLVPQFLPAGNIHLCLGHS